MSQKVYTFSTGPFKNLSSRGPATPEEFDAAAGQGKCLEGAMADAIYRGHLALLHEKFVPAVEAITGNAPKVDEKRTAAAQSRAKAGVTVDPVLETAVTYLDREYELATAEQKAAIEKAVRDIASAEFIDVSPTQRQSGPKKAFLERANQILGRDADGIEAAIATILAKLPSANIERDPSGKPTADSLALALEAITEAAKRDALGGL